MSISIINEINSEIQTILSKNNVSELMRFEFDQLCLQTSEFGFSVNTKPKQYAACVNTLTRALCICSSNDISMYVLVHAHERAVVALISHHDRRLSNK